MDTKEVVIQWFINFDKKSSGFVASGAGVKSEDMSNQELAEELHKPIIRKFEKRKVYSSFKDNIWGADLADMQLRSKFNEGFLFLLYVVDIYVKYFKEKNFRERNLLDFAIFCQNRES